MKGWNKIPFGDILTESRDGEWGEAEAKPGYQLCEVIRGTDFASLYSPHLELPKRWIQDHLVERKKLAPLDLIFEMAGGTAKQSTGRSALIKKGLFSRHSTNPLICASFCRHLRIDQKDYSPTFIYYLLQALYSAGYMAVFNIQHTGVSRFQYTTFKKMTKLDVPHRPIQCKIASVLSAYDDFIENNNSRMTTMEKMAEELYREWFVRLRFPEHEKVKIVKGLPEGWEVKKIKSVVDRKRFGKIYRENELYPDGKVIVIDQSAKDWLGFHDGEPEHVASIEKPIIIFGDHSCKMRLMLEPFALSENVIPFTAKGQMPSVFLFHLIHNSIETTEYKRHWTELVNKNVYIPDTDLQSEFAKNVINLHSCKARLMVINRKLKYARDCLLSRLMSGKIDVENMDIEFPASMQEEVVHA